MYVQSFGTENINTVLTWWDARFLCRFRVLFTQHTEIYGKFVVMVADFDLFGDRFSRFVASTNIFDTPLSFLSALKNDTRHKNLDRNTKLG